MTKVSWIMRRQIEAEVGVLMALSLSHKWIRGEDLAYVVGVSPWRFLGALRRLNLGKKIESSVTPVGGRQYRLAAAGWELLGETPPVEAAQ